MSKNGKKKKPSEKLVIAKLMFAASAMPVLLELIKLLEKLF